MKNSIKLNQLVYAALLAIVFISFNACSEEQVVPVTDSSFRDAKINFRSSDPTDQAEAVKVKVSKRDNIPYIEILTSNYYGQTINGYWEYRLTTLHDGNKIFIVTSIIGDDIEGY